MIIENKLSLPQEKGNRMRTKMEQLDPMCERCHYILALRRLIEGKNINKNCRCKFCFRCPKKYAAKKKEMLKDQIRTDLFTTINEDTAVRPIVLSNGQLINGEEYYESTGQKQKFIREQGAENIFWEKRLRGEKLPNWKLWNKDPNIKACRHDSSNDTPYWNCMYCDIEINGSY